MKWWKSIRWQWTHNPYRPKPQPFIHFLGEHPNIYAVEPSPVTPSWGPSPSSGASKSIFIAISWLRNHSSPFNKKSFVQILQQSFSWKSNKSRDLSFFDRTQWSFMKYDPFKSCGSSILYVEKNKKKHLNLKQKKLPLTTLGGIPPKQISQWYSDTLVELLKIPKTFSSILSGHVEMQDILVSSIH